MTRLFGRARALMAAVVGGVSVLAIAPRVQVLPHPLAPRVDITIDGKPFASYVYLTAMPRPALVSLRGANGAAISKDDENGERRLATGFWLAHGNVNGIDFSDTARLVHRRVVEAQSSEPHGRLAVQTAWTAADGSTLVLEDTYFTFAGTEHDRIVDRVTRLAAVNGPVRFDRTTRTLVGLQLSGGFNPGEAMSDGQANRPAPCAEGRGRWIAIPGVTAGQPTTVALLEHPDNAGAPNIVRCRADALELAPSGETHVEAGASVTLRYRLIIVDGHASGAEIERRFREFTEVRASQNAGR